MESIKSYLLSVIITALAVSILTSVLNKKSSQYRIIQTIGGLIVLAVIISPWKNIKLSNIDVYYNEFAAAGQRESDYGKTIAEESLRQIIKEQTESYIIDKATQFEATLQVNVSLNNDTYPSPIAVILTGNISPYGKEKLTHIIEEDLGIPEDKQTWN